MFLGDAMGYRLRKTILLSVLANELGIQFTGEDVVVKSVAPFDQGKEGDLCFVTESGEYLSGGAFIVPEGNLNSLKEGVGYLVSSNPRLAFIKCLEFLSASIGFSTYDFCSNIHPTAVIGKNVVIEDGCHVGKNTVIEHNVVIHPGTRIGNNTRIRSCSSIGGDGFGFQRDGDDIPIRFVHLGGVVIGNNVEIGACTTIARGVLSDTVIEDYVKIDNLVHVAHNCLIKRSAIVIACAEISGSVVVGENAWIAPNSCTHQKISIGRNSIIGLGAAVIKDVPSNVVYAGNPARKLRDIS